MLFDVFRNKRVLVTGHTGFKGAWLCLWLNELGAHVSGVSNGVPTDPSLYRDLRLSERIDEKILDIRDAEALEAYMKKIQPEFVFHLAAQPLVYRSFLEPLETFSSNALGTANLLTSLRSVEKKIVCVCITSDKVYKNNEWVWGYRENDALGGTDPYSASKAMAELVIRSFTDEIFSTESARIRIGVSRAGNVIGGGDWAEKRLFPDIARAVSSAQKIYIRNPNATRPWQHVLEPLRGYLMQAAYLHESSELSGEAFNFGPDSANELSVSAVLKLVEKYWCPLDDQSSDTHSGVTFPEARLLRLNCDKAASILSWVPLLSAEESISWTIDWYKNYYTVETPELLEYTNSQIKRYTGLMLS